MADKRPLKLEDIGNGEGRLKEFEDGDKIPIGLLPVVGDIDAGAIIERGSNANGSYVKFADGSLVCYNPAFLISYASTGVMEGTWTFPHVFYGGGPHWVGVTLESALAFAQCVGLPIARGPSDNTATVGFRSPANTHTPGTTAVVRVSARGRWK